MRSSSAPLPPIEETLSGTWVIHEPRGALRDFLVAVGAPRMVAGPFARALDKDAVALNVTGSGASVETPKRSWSMPVKLQANTTYVRGQESIVSTPRGPQRAKLELATQEELTILKRGPAKGEHVVPAPRELSTRVAAPPRARRGLVRVAAPPRDRPTRESEDDRDACRWSATAQWARASSRSSRTTRPRARSSKCVGRSSAPRPDFSRARARILTHVLSNFIPAFLLSLETAHTYVKTPKLIAKKTIEHDQEATLITRRRPHRTPLSHPSAPGGQIALIRRVLDSLADQNLASTHRCARALASC